MGERTLKEEMNPEEKLAFLVDEVCHGSLDLETLKKTLGLDNGVEVSHPEITINLVKIYLKKTLTEEEVEINPEDIIQTLELMVALSFEEIEKFLAKFGEERNPPSLEEILQADSTEEILESLLSN